MKELERRLIDLDEWRLEVVRDMATVQETVKQTNRELQQIVKIGNGLVAIGITSLLTLVAGMFAWLITGRPL